MSKPVPKTSDSLDDGRSVRAMQGTSGMKFMGRLAARLMACTPLALLAVTGTAAHAAGTYARMAPVNAYLMDHAEEIALARSAAPE